MAYEPIQNPKWSDRDSLPQGDSRKIVKGEDFDTEFSNIETEFNAQKAEIDTNTAGIAKAQSDIVDLQIGGSQILASCKFNGVGVRYGYNVREVIQPNGQNNGFERVVFENPINVDEPIELPDGTLVNPGDFAAVFTGYTTANTMSIFSVTDQREEYIDVAIRVLGGNGQWEIPSERIGFAMILVDQVPG